jgi:hypothetical protein
MLPHDYLTMLTWPGSGIVISVGNYSAYRP